MSGHDGRVWLRLRTQRFGLRTGTPIKDLIERGAQLLRRTDVSKADVCGRARPLLSRRVLLTDRGLKRLHMPKTTKSPLRFASVCFPLLPRLSRQRRGSRKRPRRTVLTR